MRIAAALSGILVALALAACTTATYQANAVAVGPGATLGGDRDAGARIFAAHCASCHGPQGGGGGIGPSLRDESRRLDSDALPGWIKDPEPPMPALYPNPLSERDVRDVAAYVESL